MGLLEGQLIQGHLSQTGYALLAILVQIDDSDFWMGLVTDARERHHVCCYGMIVLSYFCRDVRDVPDIWETPVVI